MAWPLRLLLTATLALSLWMGLDGVRCLTTGAYAARVLTPAQAARVDGVVVVVADGRLVEYGPWAWPLVELGVHPNSLAPFFVGLSLFGFLSLAMFLFGKRAMGWRPELLDVRDYRPDSEKVESIIKSTSAKRLITSPKTAPKAAAILGNHAGRSAS